MFFVSILGLISIFILFVIGFFDIKNYVELYAFLCDYTLLPVLLVIFICISIYCWVLYFIEIFSKQRKVLLYSIGIDNDVVKFINKKGKIFLFFSKNVTVGKFYYVLKKNDHIIEILNESCETFVVPKEKKSYWLNFYFPTGSCEDLLLLPIVYVGLIPGVLGIIMNKGYYKIFGIIVILFPLYLIIYDFIYKIKLSNNNYVEANYNKLLKDIEIDYDKLLKLDDKFTNFVLMISSIIINVFLFYLYTKTSDYISRVILIPFCLCSLCFFGLTVSKKMNNDFLIKFFKKCFLVFFILFFVISFILGIIEG